MKNARTEYEAALAAFILPGARWSNKGALTYWGKAAGMSADEILADVHAAGVRDRDTDIRNGWDDARPRFINETPTADYVPRAKATPAPQFTRHVRDMIEAGGESNLDALRELSPSSEWIDRPVHEQTAAFFKAAFSPGDMLHIFRDDVPTAGIVGANIRTAADWLQYIEYGGQLNGDLIVPNPFTGVAGETTAGKRSFIAQSCLAAFPYIIIEFDDMPLEKQCAFWRGFIQRSKLAPALVSLTHSGNKSIHGLIHIGCESLDEWKERRQSIRALFASDTDASMRADDQAMQPRQGVRVPGINRFDNGALQRLVYLNPDARADNMRFITPPCRSACGAGYCGVCAELARCPFADRNAVPGTTLKPTPARTSPLRTPTRANV